MKYESKLPDWILMKDMHTSCVQNKQHLSLVCTETYYYTSFRIEMNCSTGLFKPYKLVELWNCLIYN